MTTAHDPLCRLEHDCPCCLGREEVCDCDLIARVREAERAIAMRDALEAIKANRRAAQKANKRQTA